MALLSCIQIPLPALDPRTLQEVHRRLHLVHGQVILAVHCREVTCEWQQSRLGGRLSVALPQAEGPVLLFQGDIVVAFLRGARGGTAGDGACIRIGCSSARYRCSEGGPGIPALVVIRRLIVLLGRELKDV